MRVMRSLGEGALYGVLMWGVLWLLYGLIGVDHRPHVTTLALMGVGLAAFDLWRSRDGTTDA